MKNTPPGIPDVYAAFLHLTLWPWLRRADRVDALRDVAELRDVYLATSGRRGLAVYTWRQLLHFPFQLARPRRGALRNFPAREKAIMDSLVADIRIAARTLRRSPLLALTVVAILAVAISANSTIFSVVHAVLIRPLPFPEPDRVVALWNIDGAGARSRLTPGTLVDARELGAFEHVGAFLSASSMLTPTDGEPEIVQGARVTLGYFETLGRAPLLGRVFEPRHYDRGEKPVVILSHDLWLRSFHGDRDVVGRDLLLGGTEYEVVAIMPRGVYPSTATIEATLPLRAGGPDFWVPIRFQEEFYGNRSARILGVIARLASSTSVSHAQAAVAAGGAALVADGRLPQGDGLTLTSFRDEAVGAVERALTFLLLTVAAVLLIAASNIAALLLTRAESRQGELAVRAALGAGRWRLVRLQLIETLLLAAAGGVAGIAATPSLLDLLRASVPTRIPLIETATTDGAVVAFTSFAVLGITLTSGLVPALFATRRGLLRALCSSANTRTVGTGRRRLQSGLVIGQTALAAVLVVASSLLVRSFLELGAVDLGFDETRVLTISLVAPDTVSDDPVATLAFWGSLERTLAEIPGVAAVGLGSDRPVERSWIDGFLIEGAPDDSGQTPMASLRQVSPGYFEALKVPIVAGRGVSETDRTDTAPVAFINEAAAREFFGGVDPIGQRITIPSLDRIDFDIDIASSREIVGVVGDIRHLGPSAAADPSIYLPLQQFQIYSTAAVIREDPTRTDTAAAVRERLRDIDRTLTARSIEPLSLLVGNFTARERFATVLISAFGTIGLLLSAMGLYALVARVVTFRTREYGLRLAIGAPPTALLRDVFSTALRPVLVGVVVGMAAAAPVTMAMRSQLFGIEPLDPLSFATGPIVLLLVALLAASLCARRAVSVDPVQALRGDD